jgi:hypothetical protein
VCDVCSAFLSVYDSNRRLADHFGGKLHLGYMQIRNRLTELKEKFSRDDSREFNRRNDRDRRRRDREQVYVEERNRDRDYRRKRPEGRATGRRDYYDRDRDYFDRDTDRDGRLGPDGAPHRGHSGEIPPYPDYDRDRDRDRDREREPHDRRDRRR